MADAGGFENESGQIVPGGVGDPGVFFLGHLGADETGRVRKPESSDGAHVLESVVVNAARDKSVSDGDGRVCWLGKFDGVRGLKKDRVGRGDRTMASEKKEMGGGGGADDFHVEGQWAADGVNLEPLEGRRGLLIIIGRRFELIAEIGIGNFVGVEVRIERAGLGGVNFKFGRDNEGRINVFYKRILDEEVHDLTRIPVMESVVKEGRWSATWLEVFD